MNAHIRRAKDYIAKGEHCYRQAADELSAAHDEGATWAAIAQAMGRSENWVYKIIAWSKDTNGSVSSPFGADALADALGHLASQAGATTPWKFSGTAYSALRTLPASVSGAGSSGACGLSLSRVAGVRTVRAVGSVTVGGSIHSRAFLC